MKIKMDYGKEGVFFDIPDNSDILLPNHKKRLSNPKDQIINSVENPINSIPLSCLSSSFWIKSKTFLELSNIKFKTTKVKI